MAHQANAAACLALGLLLCPTLGAQQTPPVQQEQPSKKTQKEQKERKQREGARQAEDRFQYADWPEEVSVIITPEELAAFKQLATNEERESFIEHTFWGPRDPTPDTQENEYREEHYRRIAYANERFSSGKPGWKTDRGRTYILWGPPDEIESHPAGGPYTRPSWEGGGTTTTHPFEQWRYRNMGDVGQDVVLEFVDPTGSGEYRLTPDPSEKDALTHVPGAGASESELLGFSSRLDRYVRSDGTNLPAPLGGTPHWMGPFERLRRYVEAQRPPSRHFKQLEQVVSSRVVADQIQFSHRFDYLRITENSVLVPVTIQIPNREMSFVERQGVHSAEVNLYARISSVSGRTVQVFEDVIRRDIPESLFRGALQGQSIYQKTVPLAPGLYRIDVVVRDVNSGDLGTLHTRLPVQRFAEGQLASSTLILADQIEPVARGVVGLGPFVLGATKVRPRIDQAFTNAETLGAYLQVYNLRLDPQTGKNAATIRYRILRGDAVVREHTAGSSDLGQPGTQLTVEKLFSLRDLAPGDYTLEIVVTDQVTQAAVDRQARFSVRAPQ